MVRGGPNVPFRDSCKFASLHLHVVVVDASETSKAKKLRGGNVVDYAARHPILRGQSCLSPLCGRREIAKAGKATLPGYLSQRAVIGGLLLHYHFESRHDSQSAYIRSDRPLWGNAPMAASYPCDGVAGRRMNARLEEASMAVRATDS